MISLLPEAMKVWVNVGRPDIFTDEDRIFWRKFHNLIKTSSVKIHVNGVFADIETILVENSCYAGGGFKYMFWFETTIDLEQFFDEVEHAIPKFFRGWMFQDSQKREFVQADGINFWIFESETLNRYRANKK